MPRGGATRNGDLNANEVELAADSAAEQVPSIDYTEYFADFDSLRPIEQNLSLSLKLEKKHFLVSN